MPLTNWSIRLSKADVAVWDDLMYALRKEGDHRTLTRADMVRTLIALAASDPVVRAELVREVRQLPRRAS